jgi:predicted glycoside hydrolase/deacetylase ChbG (UPF0249 family)
MSSNGNGSKRLIVNADDYGWSRGITDGILKAHHDGIVTSTSMMVNRPAGEYALAQLPSAPKLGVGIHLTLSDGSPVLPACEVPTLVDTEGKFYCGAEVLRRLKKRMFSALEIEAEFRAQIRWMKERGITPTHADSHQHLHLYPVAIYAFHRALKADGISCARPSRNRYFSKQRQIAGQHGGPLYRQLAVSAYMAYIQKMVYAGLKVPDWRLVYHPKYRGDHTLLADGLRESLENLKKGTYEFVCHPAEFDPEFTNRDRIRDERAAEMLVLVEPQWKELIRQQDIKLINYAQL